MSGPRHPGTEGNDLWPADVKFPDPDGGDGRLSLVNDVAAEFSGLAISSTQPTDMPDGGLWINLSADATAVDRLSTYDESTDAFIPIQADSTVVQDSEPAHSKGLIWFDSSPEDGFDMFFSDGETWYFLQFIPEIPDADVYLHDDWGDNQLTSDREDSETTKTNGIDAVYRPEWVIDHGSPSAQNERLEMDDTDQSVRTELDLPDMDDLGKIVWEFKIDDLESGEWHYCNIVANSTDYRGGTQNLQDGYYFSTGSDDEARLHVDEDGSETTLIQAEYALDDLIRVERETGGEWELFVNGSSIDTVTDDTFNSCEYIGFGSYEADTKFIDELKVGTEDMEGL